MISNADKELVSTLVRAAKDIIKGKLLLTPSQLRALRAHERSLGELVKTKSIKSRKKILQKGGFLGLLIRPLLRMVTGSLLNALGGDRRR